MEGMQKHGKFRVHVKCKEEHACKNRIETNSKQLPTLHVHARNRSERDTQLSKHVRVGG